MSSQPQPRPDLWRTTALSLAMAASTGIACTGQIGDQPLSIQPVGESAQPGDGLPPSGGICTPYQALAPTRVWQLTDGQYLNAVRRAFEVTLSGTDAEITQAESSTGNYNNFSELAPVGTTTVQAYQAAAQKVASLATQNLAALLPCRSVTPDETCIVQFIRGKVARAARRPFSDAEVNDLVGLYRLGQVDGPAIGVASVLEAVLQTGSFLYRTELGAAPATGPVSLTSFELATALGFLFEESPPDDQLWSKAELGTLMDRSVLASEVDRLLALPDVRANLSKKASYWLGVERFAQKTQKDLALFPEFTPSFKSSLYQATTRFIEDALWKNGLADLLGSHRLYANRDLARVYGLTGVDSDNLVAVEGDPEERSAGILTQPAVLAAFARENRGDPIHRGLFIYRSIVCAPNVADPPPGARDVAATFPKDATERELAGFRAANGICRSCHGLFDSLGLVSERYDPIGRYRSADAKGPIDSSSTVRGIGPDLDGPVSGITELSSKLREGRRVADCAAGSLATFALGRDMKGNDSCNMRDVRNKMAQTGSFLELYRALATSPGFVMRDPVLGQGEMP